MQQDVAVERWVIGNTAGGYVLVWSPDPTHFGSVGAMSLNGPNALSMTTTVSEAQIAVALVGVVRHVEQLNLTELIPCLYRRQHH